MAWSRFVSISVVNSDRKTGSLLTCSVIVGCGHSHTLWTTTQGRFYRLSRTCLLLYAVSSASRVRFPTAILAAISIYQAGHVTCEISGSEAQSDSLSIVFVAVESSISFSVLFTVISVPPSLYISYNKSSQHHASEASQSLQAAYEPLLPNVWLQTALPGARYVS